MRHAITNEIRIRRKIERYNATILTDDNHILATKWDLGDCDDKSVVLVVGTDKKLKYIKKGPVRGAQIQGGHEVGDAGHDLEVGALGPQDEEVEGPQGLLPAVFGGGRARGAEDAGAGGGFSGPQGGLARAGLQEEVEGLDPGAVDAVHAGLALVGLVVGVADRDVVAPPGQARAVVALRVGPDGPGEVAFP